jgi:hypothetical protein
MTSVSVISLVIVAALKGIHIIVIVVIFIVIVYVIVIVIVITEVISYSVYFYDL